MKRSLAPLLLSLLAVIIFSASFYRLPEWEQAVIIQLGKPVRRPVRAAGAHFHVPFIEKVVRLDKRILNWDGNPERIPTNDGKYIWVDTTARWRIVDPLLFIQSVRDEDGARSRLDAILETATRDMISNHDLVETVRNTNDIIEKIAKRKALLAAGKLKADEEEVIGNIAPIKTGREAVSRMIIEKARSELGEIGVEIIDVQLRRIAYEQSVERKAFERMISERQRIAQRIRSRGHAEQSQIRGKIQKDLKLIESDAYRKAETIKGKADGEAIRIYAGAMNQDPGFYDFLRTLEAYKKALPADTKLILSTGNKFLELLRKK